MKAKVLSENRGEGGKIGGTAHGDQTVTAAPDRNGQTLTEGAHRVTAIPHSTPTDPVRTDNRVGPDRDEMATLVDSAAYQAEHGGFPGVAVKIRTAAAELRKMAEVEKRLRLWASMNIDERERGSVPTFLNPWTVLGWMGHESPDTKPPANTEGGQP